MTKFCRVYEALTLHTSPATVCVNHKGSAYTIHVQKLPDFICNHPRDNDTITVKYDISTHFVAPYDPLDHAASAYAHAVVLFCTFTGPPTDWTELDTTYLNWATRCLIQSNARIEGGCSFPTVTIIQN